MTVILTAILMALSVDLGSWPMSVTATVVLYIVAIGADAIALTR